MLTKPDAGWTHVSAFGIPIGSASYLDDVPATVLDEITNYLDQLYAGNPCSFSLCFDSEGSHCGIVLFNDTLYRVDTKTDTPPYIRFTDELRVHRQNNDNDPNWCYQSARDLIARLGEEAYHDIRYHLDDWKYWNTNVEDERDALSYKMDYARRCVKLRTVLNQLYNRGTCNKAFCRKEYPEEPAPEQKKEKE